MKKINFYNLFYIFIFGSVFGWISEGIWTLLKKGVLINHSALVIGPFNIIYGLGAVFLTILLNKYKDSSYIKLYFVSFIIGTILEYIMSMSMEYMLGFTAWNYSKKFLNINGRVALMYSAFWGLLGVFWIKWCYPKVILLIEKINKNIGKIIIICLSLFLVFDVCLTFSAINRARAFDNGIEPSNNYERFLDKTFNRDYLKNMFNNHWK